MDTMRDLFGHEIESLLTPDQIDLMEAIRREEDDEDDDYYRGA